MRDPSGPTVGPVVARDEVLDALFDATAEAAEAALYDALFSARTMSGARNLTFYALPIERVRALLQAGTKTAQ